MTPAAASGGAERSFEPLTDEHLARLAKIVRADHEDGFSRCPRWKIYQDRVGLVALCQGATLPYLYGRNGVKDLDVWTFYARHLEGEFPARWRVMANCGFSPLGRHPYDTRYFGRHVDVIGRSINAVPSSHPVRAVRPYLRAGGTASARSLAGMAVVALDLPELLGTTVRPC